LSRSKHLHLWRGRARGSEAVSRIKGNKEEQKGVN
jgi:hypothetical protein